VNILTNNIGRSTGRQIFSIGFPYELPKGKTISKTFVTH
jgi:hypothetical protein